MKFGDTLYQRSVPKWAAYNVNYNEIKRLIKTRTTSGLAAPIAIPGQTNNRWAELDAELFDVLEQQHDNISLFCTSKYGEIDRRLIYLEKQVRSAQRSTRIGRDRPLIQARKWQRLLQDAEEIGDDIQSLSRFLAVQKTAFRKILKKYRKWTGSIHLQTRLENGVFAAGKLHLDFADLLSRLTTQSNIISHDLSGPMVRGEQPTVVDPITPPLSSPEPALPVVRQLNEAATKGGLDLDATFAIAPFGKSAGTATYWIHPDNLEEAEVLLLRHVQQSSKSRKDSLSRVNSFASLSTNNTGSRSNVGEGVTHVIYYDNIQRFQQDFTSNKPSKIALSGRWSRSNEAVVTTSNLTLNRGDGKLYHVKRKDLANTLDRENSKRSTKDSPSATGIRAVQDYLSEHRDIKPLAEVHSNRSSYIGTSNSSEVGTWACLDTNIVFSPPDHDSIGDVDPEIESGEAFPHAVLEIRWEFGRKPEVVRVFDTTHLAERMYDFSIESAALHSQCQDLTEPGWKILLQKDIRKVPIMSRVAKRNRDASSHVTTSSGPSSTDGPADSVFSAAQGYSTGATESSPHQSVLDLSPQTHKSMSSSVGKKKRAKIIAKSPVRKSTERYWNEYDDGDSDTNQDDAYAIYVDPNQGFPGAETVSKAFGAMYESFGRGKAKMISWLPLSIQSKPEMDQSGTNERSPLLFPGANGSTEYDGDSSDSDTPPMTQASQGRGRWDKHTRTFSSSSALKPRISRRRRALERTYFQFYTGLLILSYMFLFMTITLLTTGRRKVALEVDIGAVLGIAAAEVSAVVSAILISMRKTKLGAVHWGIFMVAFSGVVIIGIALLVATVDRVA